MNKWYDKKGLVILLIVVFWPIGLYGSLKNRQMSRALKLFLNILFGGVFVIFLIGIIAGGAESEDAPVVSEPVVSEPIVSKPDVSDLGITLEQFIDSYETALKTLENEGKIKEIKRDDSGDFFTLQLQLDTYRGFVATIDKDSNFLRSVIFTGSGDGTTDSGLKIIIGAVAFGMALEDPKMSMEDRNALSRELGVLDGRAFKEAVSLKRNGIAYYGTVIEGMGFMLSAEPVK